jgi:predicted transcriptional regulator of viral defense system
MKQFSLIAIAQILQQHELFVFRARMLGDLLGLSEVQTSQLLKRMEAAGLAARVERGIYVLLGLSPEHVLSNPLFIGCNLVTPAYVSFWSALHYHGFTEQAPQTTFIATTQRKPGTAFHSLRFQFVTVQPKSFFGYLREQYAGLPVVVADEEKTFLDCLMLPEYAGGMTEVARALNQAAARLNIETLIEYTRALDSPSLEARLGYLLEYFGKPVEGIQGAKGPVNLDPSRSRRGRYNARWRVYVNLTEQELTPEGVV